MFKFSFDWLKAESQTEVTYDALIQWLDEQGFEIASIEKVGNDTVIEIEVKANRPDMLCVEGVLREFYASKSIPECKKLDSKVKLNCSESNELSHRFEITSSDVHRYYAAEIRNLDNTGETPAYMKERLTRSGVACINPVVDVSNYVLLQIGQPIHVFDADKLKGTVKVENIKGTKPFVTLAGGEITLPDGALLISDEEAPLCLAGIIGGKKAEVDANTKNIIIESANFDHIIIRTTSKKTHVTTAASYRFERGVTTATSELGARRTAEYILDICGGELNKNAFVHTDGSGKQQIMELSTERTNSILGSRLTTKEISELLKRCFFENEEKREGVLEVKVPAFRLDIEFDVDLIEEVGRIYGYHNIEPQPIKLYCPYKENPINKNANKLRDMLVGYGFIEILSYAFIPSNAMETLNLKAGDKYYGDIVILNPLSSYYSLMRPTMAYCLVGTAIRNMALDKKDMKIFEIGRTFLREDGKYKEKDSFAGLLCGVKNEKGFGVGKEAKYNVFDGVSAVRSLLDEFNVKYEIRNTESVGFFEKGAGAEILINGKVVGIVGKISNVVLNAFENGKLAKDDVIYFEFYYGGLEETKRFIAFESNYQSVRREYNFVVKSGLHFADYSEIIKKASPFVVKVKPLDIYQGAGVTKGTAAVLISVTYNALTRTLEAAEIEEIENKFKQELAATYGIELKKE